jgi:EmrB/QacA subfamily drug resistance transporter
VVGGVILGQASWRWIFVVNLPVGIAAVLLARRLLPEAKPRLGQTLDLRGLALLSPGIALFLYGLSQAGTQGGFEEARTIAAAVIGLLLVALFVWHASVRTKDALIDVSLFLRRGFATEAGVNFVLGLALFGSLILLPLYYQLVRGESPLATGLLLVPQGIGAALAMPVAGRLTDEIGARAVVPAGMGLAGLGMLAFTQVGTDTSYALLAGALLLVGLGLGATIVPSMAVVFQSLERDETPRATSALNTIQRIAGAVGTALLAIVLQRAIEANVPGLDGGIQGMAALSQHQRAQVTPAIAAAFGTTFWVSVMLVGVALVPAFLLPRRERREESAIAVEQRAA